MLESATERLIQWGALARSLGANANRSMAEKGRSHAELERISDHRAGIAGDLGVRAAGVTSRGKPTASMIPSTATTRMISSTETPLE